MLSEDNDKNKKIPTAQAYQPKLQPVHDVNITDLLEKILDEIKSLREDLRET